MQVRDLMRSCGRRWYVVLLGCVFSLVAGYIVGQHVGPTYRSSASFVLTPPRDVVVTGKNPYLYLGGLEQAMGVLQVSLNSPEISKPLAKEFPSASYLFAKDYTTTGPIMSLAVTGASATGVKSLMQKLSSLAVRKLSSLQGDLNVPGGSRIHLMTLSMEVTPSISHKGQVRSWIVVLGLGLTMTILLAGWFDRLLLSRTRRDVSFDDHEGVTDGYAPGLKTEKSDPSRNAVVLDEISELVNSLHPDERGK